MQILLLQDRLEVREKVVFFIESTYGARVHEASTFSEGLKLLSKQSRFFDLIILDAKQGEAAEMAEFKAKTDKIPTLLCIQGGSAGLSMAGNVAGFIDRSAFIVNISKVIDELIEKGTLTQIKGEGGQCRIKTKLLLSVCPLEGDIYIRLSENKFVKLFKEGDIFDHSDLEKYTVKKGVEYLYIRKEQCLEFANKYKTELEKILQAENLSIAEVSELGTSVHETIQELNREIGFSKEVQELAKTQVQITVKAMGKDPNLEDILKKIQSSEEKYISSHSTLCAFVSCAIAGQLKWGSESTFFKLSLAAFMHDVTLENHELAELDSLGELDKNKSKFTEKEVKDFKDHPMFAAEMAKKMTEVPPDVDTIIRQHHEKPDGTGFPRGIGHTYIAPLSSIFIVAHDLSKYTLKAGSEFDVDKFINGARERYTSSQFKKVLSCLETIHKIKALSAKISQSKKA